MLQLTCPRPRRRKRYDDHLYAPTMPNIIAVLLPPINFIFKLLQSRATISVWLYENLGLRIEGKLRVRLPIHHVHPSANEFSRGLTSL
jgi:hypothetical protein